MLQINQAWSSAHVARTYLTVTVTMNRSRCQRNLQTAPKKRCVEYSTFQKWQRDLNRELQMMSWLDCNQEAEGVKKGIINLKCNVCTEFVDKISPRKNFSNKWIVGASI